MVTFRRAKYGSCDNLCAANICFHQACHNDYTITGQTCSCTTNTQATCGVNMNCASSPDGCVCKGAGYTRVSSTDASQGCYLDVLQTAFGADVASVSSFVEANLFQDAITVMTNTGALGKYNSNEKNQILAHFSRFFLGQELLVEADFANLYGAYSGGRALNDKGIVVSEQCSEAAYSLGQDLVMKDLVTMGLAEAAAATMFNPTSKPGLRTEFTDTLLVYEGTPSDAPLKTQVSVQINTDFFTTMKWEHFRAAFLTITGQSAQKTAASAQLFLNQLLAVIATKGYSLKSMTDGLMNDVSTVYDNHRAEMAECFTDVPDTLCDMFGPVSGTGSSTIVIDMKKSSNSKIMQFNMIYDCYGDIDDVEVWYEGKKVRDFGTTTGRQTPTPISYGPGNSQLVEIRIFPSKPTSTWKVESLTCAQPM